MTVVSTALLTCIFLSYEENLKVVAINPPGAANGELFSENLQIKSDKSKADWVLKAFKKFASARGANLVYYPYLSEGSGIELEILKYFQHTFHHKKGIDGDYANPQVLKIA